MLFGFLAITIACAATGASSLRAEEPVFSSLDIPATADGPLHSVTGIDLVTLREVGGMVGSGLSISPDGKHLAFEMHKADVALNNYQVAWFVSPTVSGGTPIIVGDGGDAVLFRDSSPNGHIGGAWVSDYAAWSPDSRGIAYRKRISGQTQIWWSSTNGQLSEQLTHSAADVDAFSWSQDGSKLYFTTDLDRAAVHESGESRYRSGYVFDYTQDWSTIDGRRPYSKYSLIGGQSRIWVLDVETRVERLASDTEATEYRRLKQPYVKRVSPAGARRVILIEDQTAGVAWVQPDDPDKQGRSPPMTLYASLHADGSNPVRCPAIECTGIFDLSRPLRDGLHWSSVDGEILFIRKTGVGYSKRSLYGWRIGQEHVREILTTDEWLSDCSIARDRAICFRETPSYPRTIVSIDLANGSIETIVDPNPEFSRLLIGDVELFEWENSQGYGTFGYLVRPPDYVPGRRYPMVIVGYRARWALRGGVGDEYPVHLLASNGFVVLVYDKPTTYKAMEIYTDPIEISKARWGPDLFDVRMPLSSFESAIRILADEGLVDATRVGVTGLSNGVGHVNYSLIHSDLFSAAISSSSDFGPSNYFLNGSNSEFLKEHRRAIGAGRYGGPDDFLWHHMSLALNAGRVRTPLLVNAGRYEHVQALEEVTALIENEKPVEFVVYPDEHHIKWQPAHRFAIYERNVDWLNFWLQGVEDSNADKAAQYARWRKLRELHIENTESAGKEYALPRPSNAVTQH